ncbi:hypothetical protein Tco_0059362 [Tanacetum coccineum]
MFGEITVVETGDGAVDGDEELGWWKDRNLCELVRSDIDNLNRGNHVKEWSAQVLLSVENRKVQSSRVQDVRLPRSARSLALKLALNRCCVHRGYAILESVMNFIARDRAAKYVSVERHARMPCPVTLSHGFESAVNELETRCEVSLDHRPRVMVASVTSISSESSEESVGSSTSRVILFGTIPTVIPADVSTIVPTILEVAAIVTPPIGVLDQDIHTTLEIDPSEDSSSSVHALVAPITSLFLCSDSSEPSRDFSDSDSSDSLSPPDSHEVAIA